MKLVVDASVAAKWLLAEALSPKAQGLVQPENELVVPELFWAEMGNILWKAVRKERITGKSADEALQSMSDLRIPTFPSHPLLRDAFTIAVRFQCTVYDCTYVALAVASERTLVTADERLANSLAAHLPVRWLGSV